MSDMNKDSILDEEQAHAREEETRAHLERTSKLRFQRSLIGGLSGPIIFGLVVAFSGPLIQAAIAGSFLATFGIGLAGVMAIGCLYLNSRIDSRISQFDQEYQAQQISKGINSPTPTIDQKPVGFPSASNALDAAAPDAQQQVEKADEALPKTSITSERALADTIAARGAANENTPTEKSAALWQEKLAHRDETPIATARG